MHLKQDKSICIDLKLSYNRLLKFCASCHQMLSLDGFLIHELLMIHLLDIEMWPPFHCVTVSASKMFTFLHNV